MDQADQRMPWIKNPCLLNITQNLKSFISAFYRDLHSALMKKLYVIIRPAVSSAPCETSKNLKTRQKKTQQQQLREQKLMETNINYFPLATEIQFYLTIT